MPHDHAERPDATPTDPAASPSRRRFLGAGGAAAAAAAGTLAAGPEAHAQFQFGGGTQALGQHFREIRDNEDAHVRILRQALGAQAYEPPPLRNIQVPLYRDFAARSRLFENNDTKSLLGALPLIFDPSLMIQAASFALIEARQAGWLNTLFPGFALMEDRGGAESPITALQAAQRIAPFFADPNFPIQLASQIEQEPSAENDIAILRFFLANEYMESAFYNQNIPRFFR
jgi:hypothetical protein